MSCTRRQFIAGSCVLAIGTLPIIYSLEINGKRYAMVHDESKCIGCTACMDACRETNKVPEGVQRLEIIRSDPIGEYPNVEYQFFRKSCQHCDNAPCVEVCPSGASFRDPETGIVDVDPDKCVGCKYCLAACPYQVRFINPETKAADKCDFCRKTNLAQGKLPACVESCPTNALVFGDVNDPNSDVYQLIAKTETYRTKMELGTDPHLFHIAKSTGGAGS
jgi:protein NrfC